MGVNAPRGALNSRIQQFVDKLICIIPSDIRFLNADIVDSRE